MRVLLASTSPRRRELIAQLGMEFDCVEPNCDEVIDKCDPSVHVKALARRKAFSVSGELVVGADTIVVDCHGNILEKPSSVAQAIDMIKSLCGGWHKVITGVCVRCGDECEVVAEETRLKFAEYDDKIVASYVNSGKSWGKAGAYGLQDEEIQKLVLQIDGDVNNVIGLPLNKLRKMIKQITHKRGEIN